MNNSWFGWIVIAFLTIWLLALVAFTCMSILVRCIDCNEDGNLVLRKMGLRFRRNLAERSLVIKEVKDHAFLEDEWCAKAEMAEENNIEGGAKDDYSDGGLQKCAICLEPYKVGEKVSWAKYLPNCPHAFHPECIKPWIVRQSGCPCCRSQIIDRNDLVVEICCGNKGGEKKLSRMQHREMIDETRQKGEFCIIHGLVFPPQVQSQQDADIEGNGTSVPRTDNISSDERGFVLEPRSRSHSTDDVFELSEHSQEIRASLELDLNLGENEPPPSPVSVRLGTNFLNITPPPSPRRKLYYGPYYIGPVDSPPLKRKSPDNANDEEDEEDQHGMDRDEMNSPYGVADAILE